MGRTIRIDADAAIADFIARRGVQQVRQGAKALSSKRGDWAARVRGVKTTDELIHDAKMRERQWVHVQGRGNVLVNGLGEPV